MRIKTSNRLLFCLIIIVGVLVVIAFRRASARPVGEDERTEAPLGRGAYDLLTVVSNTRRPSLLLHYRGFDVSYNPEWRIPNWVAWDLSAPEAAGSEPRGRFVADPYVESTAQPADYRLSGYDRGHMAPAGDMKWDAEAMTQCFFMTNIAPQVGALNSGPWKTLEEKCRLWAQTDSVIYIVCGPVPEEPIEYIGQNRVAVPRRFFKVIISPHANPPRGIGFIMNNGENPGGMQNCVYSIDQVESLTGYDFFSQLPDAIENDIESQHRLTQWPNSTSR